MTTPLETRETSRSPANRPFTATREGAAWIDGLLAQLSSCRADSARTPALRLVRWPQRMTEGEFYATAYPLMYLSRHLDERMEELFKKGYTKGTVTTGIGNEATSTGMTMPLRAGATWCRSCIATLSGICFWVPRRINYFASTWPTTKARRMGGKATCITATRPRGVFP